MTFDAFEFDPPEEIDNSGGNMLRKGGRFHFNVLDFFNGKTYKETPINGFSVMLEVLDGDQRRDGVCYEKGKLYHHTFFSANRDDTDDQRERSKKAQAAFLIATNAIGPEHVAQLQAIAAARAAGQESPAMHIELSKCKTMQCCALLEVYNGKLKIKFDNIWHVDDPAASDIPMDAGALALLPKHIRRTPEDLAAIKEAFGGKKGNAAPNRNSVAAPPQTRRFNAANV
jgi:hypothetical protein